MRIKYNTLKAMATTAKKYRLSNSTSQYFYVENLNDKSYLSITNGQFMVTIELITCGDLPNLESGQCIKVIDIIDFLATAKGSYKADTLVDIGQFACTHGATKNLLRLYNSCALSYGRTIDLHAIDSFSRFCLNIDYLVDIKHVYKTLFKNSNPVFVCTEQHRGSDVLESPVVAREGLFSALLMPAKIH